MASPFANLSAAATARFPALAARDYRNLLFGQLVSMTGSQMQQVAVAWQLYLFTRSPLALGLLGAFRVGPIVFFALWGGVVADVVDRRRLMLVTQSVLACVSLALALGAHFGFSSPGFIYACAAVAGGAIAFDSPARQSLIPLLLPREHLPGALGLSALALQIATIVGPAIAGVILGWGGVVPVYVFDAASFLAVIAALAFMRHRAPPRQGVEIGWRAAVEGLQFIRRAPIIRSTMLLDFFATFFGGSMLLMPIFADQILQVGPQGLGVLYAAQPAGAAVAGILLAARTPPVRQGQIVIWAVAAYGASIALFGLSKAFVVSLLALALSGAADTVSMVIRQTLRQLLTPDELRGRMTSVNMIFFMGGPQLGEVEAGVVARWLGPPASVWTGGLACIATALIVAGFAPALRRYRSDRPTTA